MAEEDKKDQKKEDKPSEEKKAEEAPKAEEKKADAQPEKKEDAKKSEKKGDQKKAKKDKDNDSASAEEEGDGKKKKKKKKKGKGLNWLVAFEKKIVSLKNSGVEILRGLISRDRPTRRMALFFILSVMGLGVVTVQGWKYYSYLQSLKVPEVTPEQTAAQNLKKLIEKQKQEQFYKTSTMSLGDFLVEVKPEPGQRPIQGVVNMAQLEIFIECNNKKTCDYISSNMEKARDTVNGVLIYVKRQEVLSFDGKRKLKKKLIKNINRWLPSGRIQKLFFSKIIMT